MTKAIEILFRHKVRLLALLILPVLVGAVIGYKLPREYQASAGLWALRRYEIIGATGPESDLTNTPASTQATTVSELLLTRSFALAVAYDTDLPKILGRSNPTAEGLQDALFNEISQHVLATPLGYNLFQITYTNTDPVVALQVVKAVVSHYGTDSGSAATAEGQQLVTAYGQELNTAEKQAKVDTQKAAQYLQQHNLTPAQALVDPQYQLLVAQVNQDNAVVATLQGDINTVQQELTEVGGGSAGSYTVIDPPSVPSRPQSATKTLLLAGGISLAVGLLAAIVYFLILVRLDQSLYTLADMPNNTPYSVLMQIPRLPRRSMAWTTQTSGKFLLEKGK